MIKRCLIFILAIAASSLFAIDITWQGPKNVFSPAGGMSPDLAVDPRNGQLHIIAVSASTTPSGVIYAKLDPTKFETDNYWLIQETIPNTGSELRLSSDATSMGPAIAVDQAGNPHVCYRTVGSGAYINNIMYTSRSASGWSAPLTIRSNVSRGYAVQIAVDRNNVVHLVHGEAVVDDLSDGQFSYYQIRSNQIIKTQIDVGKYHGNDRLAIDVDPDNGVHVLVAPQYPPYEGPVYYYSQGGSASLERVADIHSLTASGRNGAPDVFADQSGIIHFAYGTQVDTDTNNKGSVRYKRYDNEDFLYDKAVTPASGTGTLESWKSGNGWGLGGVAATSDGQIVFAAYLTRDNGPLYSVYSTDSGQHWSAPIYHAPAWGITDGRSLHVIKAYQNNIYLVYLTQYNTTRIQYLKNIGDELPTASAGGPYVGSEGASILFDGSASTDTGQNAGIALYEWDWNLDGAYDFSSSNATVVRAYMDDYSGQVRLRVTDLSGNTAIDLADVTVENTPPVIEIGPDRVVNEGASVNFSASVTDPGQQDTHTFVWSFSEGGQATGQTASRSYADNGAFSVSVQCEDDDGGTDSDILNVTVGNLPPTAEAGGPYSGTRNLPVNVTGSGADPGVQDILTYSWDLNGDGAFEIPGLYASMTYALADTYTIWFRVADDDGSSDIDSAFIIIRDDAPEIQPVPVQIAFEGDTAFAPLLLDNYVRHPSQDPQNMTWSVEGGEILIDTLTNHTLNVLIPDGDWSGQEVFKLYVTDLGGIMDSSQVVYRVDPMNDPPFWTSNIPNYNFNEDGSLDISFISLRAKASDSDNGIQDLIFDIEGNNEILIEKYSVEGRFHLSAPLNWHGSETVTFSVQDPDGLRDTDESLITVNSVNDPPLGFELITPFYMRFEQWPESIECAWHTTTDPDTEDVLTYEWYFWQTQGAGGPEPITIPVTDTTLTFFPDSTWDTGVYGWKIIVFDGTVTVDCDQPGYFRKDPDPMAGIEDDLSAIPTEFELMQNYPNPFNPETSVRYTLPKSEHVVIEVFNALGQYIATLADQTREAGYHTLQWDGSDQPSGIYVLVFRAGSYYKQMKMILLK